MIVWLLFLAALTGGLIAIGASIVALDREDVGDADTFARAQVAAIWGATAAVFFLVLALLIWVVQ